MQLEEVFTQIKECVGTTIPRTIKRDLQMYFEEKLITQCCLRPPKKQNNANMGNVIDVIKNGVFSNMFIFRITQDQLQFIAPINCILFTLAWPGEVAVSGG